MESYVASHLKDMNRQVVYNYIREKGETSRAEISRATNISSPTVIKIVNFLIENNLVTELGEGVSALGRKPQMLTLNTDLMYAVSFFLEGDFLSMGIVDTSGKVIYKTVKKVVPSFDEIFKQISSGLVEEIIKDANVDRAKMIGIGIALPAVYNHNIETIVTAPLIGIHKPVDVSVMIDSLARKYEADIIVENDTNAQVIGEYRLSYLGKDADLIFISLGTGLGAGVILDGALRYGVRSMCGEIGYISFMEDYMVDSQNAGWLESKINYRLLEDKFSVRFDVPVSEWPEGAARDIIEYVSIPIALCINNITMFLDCENVVIGGIITEKLDNAFLESVNKKISSMSIADIKVKKQFSNDVGLVGIASLLLEKKIMQILTGS